jgi:hypothetical protein
MATELTLVLRFEEGDPPPLKEDIEYEFDCTVMEYEEEEV